ncbi:MAG: hypothetical protein IPH45_07645 [Bacteroidales bacterium]|nr:hypothetical protein [Bacteroidales bacterium]
METKGTIILDWNGTLLDDTAICLDSMNQMLSHRHLPLLTLEKYREVFTFPVIQYYTTIGFDFETEPWDKAAIGFIELYLKPLPLALNLLPEPLRCLNFSNNRVTSKPLYLQCNMMPF